MFNLVRNSHVLYTTLYYSTVYTIHLNKYVLIYCLLLLSKYFCHNIGWMIVVGSKHARLLKDLKYVLGEHLLLAVLANYW